jgi:hypothetical protein
MFILGSLGHETYFKLILVFFILLLAGLTFTSSVGPIGIFYLTLGFTIALLLHFIAMNVISKFKLVSSYNVVAIK